jgi:hypothetical protein
MLLSICRLYVKHEAIDSGDLDLLSLRNGHHGARRPALTMHPNRTLTRKILQCLGRHSRHFFDSADDWTYPRFHRKPDYAEQ